MRHPRAWTLVVLLVLGLFALNWAATRWSPRLDLTAGNLFTLSEGTREILADLDQPVALTFYFSRGVEDLSVRLKNYATRIEILLRRYEEASDGNVEVDIVYPGPDSPEELSATEAGLTLQRTAGGEPVVFGLVGERGEAREVIPVFTPGREALLEYEITRVISALTRTEKPVLGIISSLPLVERRPGALSVILETAREWVAVSQLKDRFDVRYLGHPVQAVPDDIDVLAVIHPQGLSERGRFALDQYVLAGNPLFVAVDPSSRFQRARSERPGVAVNRYSSGLPELFEAWGVRYETNQVVADLRSATPLNTGGARPKRHPAWLTLSDPSDAVPVTAPLNQLLFVESGAFFIEPGPDAELRPLVRSSPLSDTFTAPLLETASIDSLNFQVISRDNPLTLAALLRGTFATAYPEGDPTAEHKLSEFPEPEVDEEGNVLDTYEAFAGRPRPLGESVEPATVILVADTDFLADAFATVAVDLPDAEAWEPRNDNLAFFSNALEYLAGDRRLLSLRGKGTGLRPFTTIERVLENAREKYAQELRETDRRMQAISNELREIRARAEPQPEKAEAPNAGQAPAGLPPEARAAVSRLEQEQRELEAQRRELRRAAREDIGKIENRLILLNLLPVPGLIGLFALVYFIRRENRAAIHRHRVLAERGEVGNAPG